MFIKIMEKETPSGKAPKIRMTMVMIPQPTAKIILPFQLIGVVA